MSYIIDNNILRDENGKFLYSFEAPITKIIIVDNIIIVLLDYFLYNRDNRNVFGLSKEGEMLWQMGKFQCISGPCHCVEIFLGSDNKVKVLNWEGSYMFIDPGTGKIIEGPIQGK